MAGLNGTRSGPVGEPSSFRHWTTRTFWRNSSVKSPWRTASKSSSSTATAGTIPRLCAGVTASPSRVANRTARGRCGAAPELARGRLIWFLHADSSVSPALPGAVRERRGIHGLGPVRRPAVQPFTGIRGDRLVHEPAFFPDRKSAPAIRASLFPAACLDAVGGMPDQPLMEDVELSRRLRRLARPKRMRERLEASSRRWERGGRGPDHAAHVEYPGALFLRRAAGGPARHLLRGPAHCVRPAAVSPCLRGRRNRAGSRPASPRPWVRRRHWKRIWNWSKVRCAHWMRALSAANCGWTGGTTAT